MGLALLVSACLPREKASEQAPPVGESSDESSDPRHVDNNDSPSSLARGGRDAAVSTEGTVGQVQQERREQASYRRPLTDRERKLEAERFRTLRRQRLVGSPQRSHRASPEARDQQRTIASDRKAASHRLTSAGSSASRPVHGRVYG